MSDDNAGLGITSDTLMARLGELRVNDVYIEVTDADPGAGQPSRLRAHGVRYDPRSDSIVIDAHWRYR